jgi:hypothetical protein
MSYRLIMLFILIVMFGLLIWNKLPAWVVFMGTLTVCMTLRLAPEELLSSLPILGATVGVLFTVAAGMYSTGAITLVADTLIGLPQSLFLAQWKILIPTAIGSAFFNNTPLVAMMIPVVRDVSRAARLPGAKLYMPLSFASILGGAATLIGTSNNLIIAGLVANAIAAGTYQAWNQSQSLTNCHWPAKRRQVGLLSLLARAYYPARNTDHEVLEKRLTGRNLVTPGQRWWADPRRWLGPGRWLPVNRLTRPEDEAFRFQPALNSLYHRFSLFRKMAARRKGSRTEPDPAAGGRGTGMCCLPRHADSLPGLWAKSAWSRLSFLEMDTARHEHHLVEVVVAPTNPAVGRLVAELPVRETPPFKPSWWRAGWPVDSRC